MRKIGKWVGLGVFVISAFAVGSLRSGDGADPYLEDFRVVTSIPAYHGRLVCLDSTFFPPGGTWLWATTGSNINPDWDGAHCFRIINPAAMSDKSLPPDVPR